MMKIYRVEIEATIKKVMFVKAADEDDASEIANQMFDILEDGNEEEYTQNVTGVTEYNGEFPNPDFVYTNTSVEGEVNSVADWMIENHKDDTPPETEEEENEKGICPKCGAAVTYTDEECDDDMEHYFSNYICEECGHEGTEEYRLVLTHRS